MSNRAKTTLSFIISLLIICCAVIAVYYFKDQKQKNDLPYTITLDAIGTNVDDNIITPNADGTISLPTPSKEGYNFDGWYNGNTLWTSDMILTDNVVLSARWSPLKYNITFIVNNAPTTIEVNYNTTPEYTGELEKPSTDYYTYEFSNWLPSIEPVTKDATYTAVFSAIKAKFNITLTSNISTAGTLTGAGSYDYQSNNISISASINNGYEWDGWYFENYLYTTNTSFNVDNISEHLEFEARYSITNYDITYHDKYDIPHSNITTYTVLDSNITLSPLDKTGYTFMGWYTSENGGGNKITTIDCSLARNYELYAHFAITNYTITYNLDQGTILGTNESSYNILTPTFTLINPTKAGYDFVGWTGTDITIPTMTVSITKGSIGNREYTANYVAYNSYTVTLNLEYTNAGILNGNGVYREGSTVNVSTTENTGYEFIGWYNGSTLYSINTNITIDNIDNSITLTAKYNLTNYTITYLNDDGCTNTNITSFTVLDSTITLNNISKTGYDFLGWYTEESDENKVTSISPSTAKNYELYARFNTISYTITYNLNDGNVSGTNPRNYTIETNTFTLINPTKDDHEFIGWTGTGLTNKTITVIISKGSIGNKTFTANWRLLSTTITFKTGNTTLDDITITAKPGTSISAPTVLADNYNMTGYTLDGWYTDSTLSTKYIFSTMPESNITLYGSWDYFIDEGFYPYLEEFSNASTSNTTIINSFDELVAFVEYLSFNYITQAYPFRIAYTTPSMDIVSTAIRESTYPTNCTISYSTTYVYLGANNKAIEGTLTADPTKAYITSQQEYSMLTPLDSNRQSNNTDFNINTVNKTLSVYSTNQLMYVLEKGLKPVCVANSPAERIYTKAKTVLNEICDDTMTDFEKIKVIYDWLILNVQYDHHAVNNYTNQWMKYDAWYAEGVFDKGVAVCDGISKALLILAQIENIPAVRTTSSNHAWNKVYINGNWYGIDATHGDISVGGTSNYLTYNNFLFTDSFKLSQSQNDTQYDELVANTVYDFYENADFTYNGATFDLEINSQSEFNTLLKYLKNYSSSTETYSFEFTLATTFSTTLNTLILNGKSQTGFTSTSINYCTLDYSTGQTVYLIIVTP